MPRVSRIRVEPKHLGFFLNNFWSVITLLESKEQVKDFLKDLLTHTEMKMIAKRIQIAKMLLEGYDYRSIRNYVKVTDPTIARISNLLEIAGDGLRAAIREIQKIEVDIDRERMRATPDLKKKYPMYFLPERAADAFGRELRKRRKKQSTKRELSL